MFHHIVPVVPGQDNSLEARRQRAWLAALDRRILWQQALSGTKVARQSMGKATSVPATTLRVIGLSGRTDALRVDWLSVADCPAATYATAAHVATARRYSLGMIEKFIQHNEKMAALDQLVREYVALPCWDVLARPWGLRMVREGLRRVIRGVVMDAREERDWIRVSNLTSHMRWLYPVEGDYGVHSAAKIQGDRLEGPTWWVHLAGDILPLSASDLEELPADVVAALMQWRAETDRMAQEWERVTGERSYQAHKHFNVHTIPRVDARVERPSAVVEAP